MELIANRSEQLFLHALQINNFDQNVLFTYIDTVTKKVPLPKDTYTKIYKLMERSITNPIDDKQTLGLLLNDTGISPNIYLNTESVTNNNFPPKKVWFIKSRFGTAGIDMECINTQGLEQYKLKKDFIIQEGVSNIDLYENKKYTLRYYALIYNKNFYLYKDGFAVIHGETYNETSTSAHVQFKHEGYCDPSSSIFLLGSYSFNNHDLIYKNIRSNFIELAKTINPVIQQSTDTTYSILGLDYVLLRDKTAKLIEINSYPNFTHTQTINENINLPMLSCTLKLILEGNQENYELIDKTI
jgi:hypothetical protein